MNIINQPSGNMYQAVKTWNPYVGCKWDCVYCKPSFKRVVARIFHCQGGKCTGCRDFLPHEHPDRLGSLPSDRHIWPCAQGDICFADPTFIRQIIAVTRRHPDRQFQWQSKNPSCFKQYLGDFPTETILLTTLETNRNKGYERISKAPLPSKRARDFKNLDWEHKLLTIEPILEFDHDDFLEIILGIKPEAVYIGYNTKPKAVWLPEPSLQKTLRFIAALQNEGISIKRKLIRQAVR